MSDLPGRVCAVIVAWAACILGAAAQQPAAVLSRLVVGDDRVVSPPVRNPKLGWTGGTECLVIGGVDAVGRPQVFLWPASAKGLCLPVTGTSTAFAASPTAPRVACWVPGPPGPTDEPTVRLAIFDARSETLEVPEQIPPFLRAAPMTWIADPDRLVVAKARDGHTQVVVVDPHSGVIEASPATVPGAIAALLPGAGPRQVVVGVSSAIGKLVHYAMDITTGIVSPPPASLNDRGSDVLSAVSPDGALTLEATGEGIWVSTADGRRWRLVPHAEEGAEAAISGLSGPTWSPSGTRFAYAAAVAGDGLCEVHAAELGTETISCVCRFPPLTPGLSKGGALWVALQFRFDEQGQVIEPDWSTVKAQLRITEEPLSSAQGVIVEAESVGTEPGVLSRLTGTDQPLLTKEGESSISLLIGDVQGTALSTTYMAEPMMGLAVWGQQKGVGEILSIRVTREALQSLPQGRP